MHWSTRQIWPTTRKGNPIISQMVRKGIFGLLLCHFDRAHSSLVLPLLCRRALARAAGYPSSTGGAPVPRSCPLCAVVPQHALPPSLSSVFGRAATPQQVPPCRASSPHEELLGILEIIYELHAKLASKLPSFKLS